MPAWRRRFSFMRIILLRTILRQYEPSSFGWITVTAPDSSSTSRTACSSGSTSAQSAPSIPTASDVSAVSTVHSSGMPEPTSTTRFPWSSSWPTTRPSGARVDGSYSMRRPS